MRNDIAIAWLDGLRQDIKHDEIREALLKGIEALEKIGQIENVLNDRISKEEQQGEQE